MKKTLVWLRNDLRLEDNPALFAARERGEELLVVYIFHEGEKGDLSQGSASKWWLHFALQDLAERLKSIGGHLLIAKDEDIVGCLASLLEESGADAVFWNRRYEPEGIKIDTEVKQLLRKKTIEVQSFTGGVLNEPQAIQNKSGNPFQVFTPYWKNARQCEVPEPLPAPPKMKGIRLNGLSLEALNLLPEIHWDKEFYTNWEPSRTGAEARLKKMVKGKAMDYTATRDTPSLDGTSCLSAWLHVGQISCREIYHALRKQGSEVEEGYIRQLYWRDFAHHLMYHFPHSVKNSLKKDYDLFPWKENEDLAEKWRRGETGYPIVDAGMRQLWQTGWMHNRVRMIVASLLVKHLLQDWRVGLDWFWDTLLDADLANNVMGWQWCGGSGADAAPYFRIFNPVSQGERFDPDGTYVKTYLPELAQLPKKYIHQPWMLGELELATYGVTLGENYPHPIIGLKEGRQQALDAFQKFKQLREQ